MPETAVLCLRCGMGLVFMLLRSPAGNGVIRTGAQINENVLEIAHHVSVGAERRHHVLLRRVDVLAPVHDHTGVVGVAHGLQGIAQRRTVGGYFSVRTVADMAIRMIAPVTEISE